MVRCWSMTEEDSMRGVLVRAERKESKKERRRKEKRENIVDKKNFLLLFFFFWKDQKRETFAPPLIVFFFAREEKRKRVTQNQRKKKEKKTIIKYIPRARVEMSKRLQVQRRKRPRGGYTKRVRRLFWWSVFISHVCATFTAQTEHVFFLFLLCSKEEKKICPLALTLFLLKTTQQNLRGKREEMKMRKNSSKKYYKKCRGSCAS